MSVPHTTEITVGTPIQEWSEEMMVHWSALADSVTRAVQQKRKVEVVEEQRERAAHEQELRQLRTALAASEQRALAAAQEASEQIDAMQRHYDFELASLQREPEGRKLSPQGKNVSDGQPQRTAKPANTDQVLDFARSEWNRESSSSFEGLSPQLALHWARLRSGPLFLPVSGFLTGLLIMVLVYPLLRHTPVRAANSPRATGTADAGRTTGTLRRTGSTPPSPALPPQSLPKPGAAKAAGVESAAFPSAKKEVLAPDGYAVLLAGGKRLTATRQGEPSAQYEAQLARHAGYERTAVYQKNGRYMAVVLFSSQDQARAGMEAINSPYSGRWKQTSSVVSVERWCPDKKALDPIVINGADVAVWSCGKGAS